MSCSNVAAPVGGGAHAAPSPALPPILQNAAEEAGLVAGVSGGGPTSSPELAQALEDVWGALGSLRAALEGAASVSGGGSTSSGCGCAQAAGGAAGMSAGAKAPALPDAPRPDEKPKADAKPKDTEESWKAPKGFKLQHPLKGATKTSDFGEIASIRNNRPHGGVDLAKPTGAQITAPAPGKVIDVQMPVKGSTGGTGGGNFIVVDHGNGWFTKYAHLSGTDVKVGDIVDAGDKLGKVGSTGNSTGPHLHFELYKGGFKQGNQVDGLPYLEGTKTLS